jgi:peptide/nickel transport system substrate-binding protein
MGVRHLRLGVVLGVLAVAWLSSTLARAQDAPVRGGTLVVAISADPGHLNPAITTSGATHTAAELLYNGLLGRDERGNPVPELAESWQVEQAGAVYRFRLQDGVKWHDGAPFTSADVKFSFEEVLLKYHARTKAAMGGVLGGHRYARRPDRRLPLQDPVRPAPVPARRDRGAHRREAHLPEHRSPDERCNASPVGTGPFKLVSYKKGAEIRLARNPTYFKKGLPYLDELVMRIVPDAATQVLALENGEIDFLWGVPGPQQSRLAADARVRMAQTAYNPGGSNCIMTVSFNLDRPILKEPRVRRALAHATDRQPFLTQVLFGEGKVATAPISSEISWAHAEGLPMPKFDRGEAERLLDAVGWRKEGDGPRIARGVAGVVDGTRLSIEFLHFPTFAKYGELIRQQWGAVGVGVTLRPPRARRLRSGRVQGPSLRHECHLVLQWAGPGDRRAPDVSLVPDRSGAVHQCRRLSESSGGHPLRRGEPERRPGQALPDLPADSGDRRPAASVLLAGGNPEHASVARPLRGFQAVDGVCSPKARPARNRRVSSRYVLRRLGQAPPTVAGLLLVTFLLVHLARAIP